MHFIIAICESTHNIGILKIFNFLYSKFSYFEAFRHFSALVHGIGERVGHKVWLNRISKIAVVVVLMVVIIVVSLVVLIVARSGTDDNFS